MKLLIFAMVRAAREPQPDEELMFEVQRDRQHAADDIDPIDDQDIDDFDTSERV